MNEREFIIKALDPLRASEGTLEAVHEAIDSVEKRRAPKRLITLALAAALILALAVTAYAANLFGLRDFVNLLLTWDTDDGREISSYSISQPNPENAALARPGEGIDEIITRSRQASEEWKAWRGSGGPISASEEYGNFDFNYGVTDEAGAAKLVEIADKYGLSLRRGIKLVYSEVIREQYYPDGASDDRTLFSDDIGGLICAETCGGYFLSEAYKVVFGYYYENGTFKLEYDYTAADGAVIGGAMRVSVYAEVADGGEAYATLENAGSYQTREYLTSGGERVYLAKGEKTCLIVAYLENAYFIMTAGSADGPLSDARLEALAESIDFALICKEN